MKTTSHTTGPRRSPIEFKQRSSDALVAKAAGILLASVSLLASCGGGGSSGPSGGAGPQASATGPTLISFPEITSELVVQVTGTSLAVGSSLHLEGGSVPLDSETGQGSDFEMEVTLLPNQANHLFLTETSLSGEVAPVLPFVIVQDSVAPVVTPVLPEPGSVHYTDRILVMGKVSDALSGFESLEVKINGVAAKLTPGIGDLVTYSLSNVPLAPGVPNEILVEARDGVGNESSQLVTVTYESPTDIHLVPISGDAQQAAVTEELSMPLVVRVESALGAPVSSKVVTFALVQNNGGLSETPGGAVSTLLSVISDGSGLASAYLTLGSTAGPASTVVRVESLDVQAGLLFTGTGVASDGSQINIAGGNTQRAQVNGALVQPLSVVVTDGVNPVPGVSVTFRVDEGDGHFGVAGGDVLDVVTDSSGMAQVEYTAGHLPGRNRVTADFDALVGAAAMFESIGVAPNAFGETRFSGLALDNAHQPIGGAECTLIVSGVTYPVTTTDELGTYTFSDIASGPAELFVDGRTATLLAGQSIPLETFPRLHFEDFVVIEGMQNRLPTPHYLPAISTNHVAYDGTKEVALTVAGVDGLRMVVAADSVTLIDGSKPAPGSGFELFLNQVHYNEIPMPLPNGVSARFAWTLQPSGTLFDPPVRIEMPNTTGLPPGFTVDFLSFDHSIGEFLYVSTGQVSTDGSLIESIPGSGLSVAGWGAPAPPPPPTGGAGSAPPCADEFNKDWLAFHMATSRASWEDLNAELGSLGTGDSAGALMDLVGQFKGLKDCAKSTAGGPVVALLVCGSASLGIFAGILEAHEGQEDIQQALWAADLYLQTTIEELAKAEQHMHSIALSCGETAYVSELHNELASLQAQVDNMVSGLCALMVMAGVPPLAGGACLDGALGIGAPPASLQELLDLATIFLDDLNNLLEGNPTALTPEELVIDLEVLADSLESQVQELTSAVDNYFAETAVVLSDLLELEAAMLGENCLYTVAGLSTHPEIDGSFLIGNIPAGPALHSVEATCVLGDVTYYGRSECFVVEENQVTTVPAFDLTTAPLAGVTELSLSYVPSVIEVGTSVLASFSGVLSNGAGLVGSAFEGCTLFTSSNPVIASVDANGEVTAGIPGLAFITANTDGVTAVAQVIVAEGVSVTDLWGSVLFDTGLPAVGAEVVVNGLGISTQTDSLGVYSLIGLVVPEGLAEVSVTARTLESELWYFGMQTGVTVVPDGLTDCGIIKVWETDSGMALRFDGSNDLVTFGAVAPLGQHTFEAWVKPDGNPGGAILAQNSGSSPSCTEGIILLGGGGALGYALDPGGCGTGNSVYDTVSTVGVWAHIAGTYDGAIGRLYVNGVQVGTLPGASYPSADYLRLGTYFYFSGGQSFYGGEIDELRSWNYARSPEEINATMFQPLFGSEPGLVGYWKFDEGSGQAVLDSSSVGKTGQLGTSSGVQSSDPIWVVSEAPVGAGPL
jgi:hypothetical protein